MASRIENEVERIVEELIAGSPLELVAVDYVRERDWYLRVFIDKEGGIEIDDCQELSGRLGDSRCGGFDQDQLYPGGVFPGAGQGAEEAKGFPAGAGKDGGCEPVCAPGCSQGDYR